MSPNQEDADYQAAYPFVVAHEDRQTKAWALFSYATMREALTSSRLSGCDHIVFGSWADYETWKAQRATEKPAPSPS